MNFQIAPSLQTRKEVFVNITSFLKGKLIQKVVLVQDTHYTKVGPAFLYGACVLERGT